MKFSGSFYLSSIVGSLVSILSVYVLEPQLTKMLTRLRLGKWACKLLETLLAVALVWAVNVLAEYFGAPFESWYTKGLGTYT